MSRIPTPTLGNPDALVESIVFRADGLGELDTKLRELNAQLERSGMLASSFSSRFQAGGATSRDWLAAPAMTALRTGQRPPPMAQPILTDSRSPRTARPVAPARNEWDIPETESARQFGQLFTRDLNSHEQDKLRRTEEELKAKNDRAKELESRLAEKERQFAAPSRLTGNAMTGVANMDRALGDAHTDLAKLNRELKNGVFKQSARDAEAYRKALEATRKEQERATREAQRQALQARYGDRAGSFLHTAGQMMPYAQAGAGLAMSGLRWANQHANAGLQGTVTQEQLHAQQMRFDRELAAMKMGPMSVKTRMFGMGANALARLGPGAQDAAGWAMAGAEALPEGWGQNLAGGAGAVGLAGLSKLPALAGGAFRGAGHMVGRSTLGLSSLGGGGLAGLGVAGFAGAALGLGASAIFSKYNREDAEQHVERREKGDVEGIDFKGKEYRKYLEIEDQDKRVKAIMEGRTENARAQGKAQDSRGAWGNYWGSVFGTTTDEQKQFADKDAALKAMLEKAKAGTDGGDVKAAVQAAKDEKSAGQRGLGHRNVALAGGGFETLDDTYYRVEAGFGKQVAAQQTAEGKQGEGGEGNSGLTAAIHRLIDFLQSPAKGIVDTLIKPFG